MGREPKERRAPIPREQVETWRQHILHCLQEEALTAREISSRIGLAEADVYHHLEHLRRSLQGGGKTLRVWPSVCKKCGFTFAKRQRLKKPGRCPGCRGQSITEPRFGLE